MKEALKEAAKASQEFLQHTLTEHKKVEVSVKSELCSSSINFGFNMLGYYITNPLPLILF